MDAGRSGSRGVEGEEDPVGAEQPAHVGRLASRDVEGEGEPAVVERRASWRRRVAVRLRTVDTDPRLVEAARRARWRLPGDERYGDPLSTAGDRPAHLLGQRVATLNGDRPSTLRELGLGAIQVWQALSEAQGRGHGGAEVAILFTDVVGFSDWALEAGDARAVELLRRVAEAVETPVAAHGGTLVKRMGDGHMAVFALATDGDAVASAVAAARAAVAAVAGIELAGHRPALRAGLHVGSPRRLGSDWFGVDVNVAARVGAAAGPGEVLISAAARERLGASAVTGPRRRLDAKGTPDGLEVFAVEG